MLGIALHLDCSRATACVYYAFVFDNVFFMQCGRVGLNFTCCGAFLGGSIPSSVMLQGHDSIFDIDVFDHAGPDRQERWAHMVLAVLPVHRPGGD